jgi:PPM family protein phosphatase
VLAPESVKGSVAKNVVLQALGKAPDVIVAQRRLALRSGDVLLLCSDGLSSFVTDGEIEQVLASSLTLNEACTDLVALANERGGRDNITVVAALVSEPLSPPGPNEQVAETLTTLRAFALGEGPGEP